MTTKKSIKKIYNKKYTKKNIIQNNTKSNVLETISYDFKIDFDKIKILKKIGKGMHGTTFLVSYNNNKYALKIQNIMSNYYRNQNVFREINLYKYINNLDNNYLKLFFTKLYGYEIYNNCEHKQERKNSIEKQRYFNIDNTKLCIKFLMEFKGTETLHNFFIKNKNKLTEKQIYSFCIQVCNIIYILYLGGYSHNDLHLNNIMIQKTNLKFFNFMKYKIPYEGYQLSAIDYGKNIHKKYKIKDNTFINNRELFLFREIFTTTSYILCNNYIKNCDEKKNFYEHKIKKLLFFKKIIEEKPDFYNLVKDKYSKSFPKGKTFFNIIEETYGNNELYIFHKIQNNYEWDIYDRIVLEILYLYPDKYNEYLKCSEKYKNIIPINILLEILNINNFKDYINYFVSKISNL